MTADLNEDNEMKQDITDNDQIDVEAYRKLVKTYMCLNRYKTALFWSEKVVVLTNFNAKDVYNQAQCMFELKEFNRAAHIIRNSGLEKVNLSCLYLFLLCLYHKQQYQEALNLLDNLDLEYLSTSLLGKDETEQEINAADSDPPKDDILGSIYLIKAKILESMDNRTLAIDCYILALQKSVHLVEALDALTQHEMLLAWEEKDLIEQVLSYHQKSNESDYKILKFLYESKMKKYYSTGSVCSNPDKTPVNMEVINNICSKIKQGDSSDMRKSLSTSTTVKPSSKLLVTPLQNMSPANKILLDLKNTSSSSYSIQSSLSKFSLLNSSKINTSKIMSTTKNFQNSLMIPKAIERIENSVDILVSKAEKCFYNYEFKKCIRIVDKILERDPFHKKTLFVQIGCLMELKDSNALFYMAHKLVDLYPDDAISWYAVGCYYDLINKSEQARRYLTKAASLDRLFGPAWLAFGHSFAKEKEHDQAMASYFKATQLMRGCHLPLLYIGVECGLTNNLEMAEKFFYQAMSLAPLDVFVLHEMGVIKYQSECYEEASKIFMTTLDMVENICEQNGESLTERWEPLLNNLGHCSRKMKNYKSALDYHQWALKLKPLNPQTYTAIGFIHALQGNLSEAVESFHKSLSLKRDDVVTTTILKQVFEEMMEDMTEDAPTEKLTESFSLLGEKQKSSEITSTPEAPEIKLIALKLKFEDEDNESSQDMVLDSE